MDFFDANTNVLDTNEDELFDMEMHHSDFLSDGWPASPDDLIDSFLSINGDFFKELDNSQNIQFENIPPPHLPAVTAPPAVVPPVAAAPPANEIDYHGFNDQHKHFDVSEFINFNVKNEPMSSSSSDSGLSSDNMDMDISPDYEPLSPAMSSPARSVVSDHVPITFSPPSPVVIKAEPTTTPLRIKQTAPATSQPAPQPMQMLSQKPKTIVFSSPTITTTNTKPRYVVEKAGPAPIIFEPNPAPVRVNVQPQQQQQPQPKKEVKIYKMAPTTHMVNTMNAGAPKKVTIQMKDAPGKVVQHPSGTYIINKNGGNLSGVRKLVRVPNSGRSILLPVSFQDVKDVRTIKIINASNMNKSANIKLAAANMLQQSKQGLVPKNVVISKEQLIDDSMSDPSTSDAESSVFEDVRVQPVASISNVKKIHQPQIVMQSTKTIIDHNTSDADDDDDDDDDNSDYTHGAHMTMSANGTYPKLMLTNEERRLLDKEGITLPGNYPLTKHEERELKRIRRKIRNKISAQDSRKRKKEYVDGLEERVKQCTDENQTLIKRLKLLQSQHSNLSQQVKKLQAMLTKSGMTGSGSKTTQPATCLMVLLLSLALVAAPNLKLGQSAQETELSDALQDPNAIQQRSLLFDTNEQLGDALVDEEMNMDDIEEHNYAAGSKMVADAMMMCAKKTKRVGEYVDFDVDDVIWKPPSVAADSQFSEKATLYQESLKTSAHLLDIGHGSALDGLNSAKTGASLFDVKVEPFDRLAGADAAALEAKKLNESKVVNGERTILMKGA